MRVAVVGKGGAGKSVVAGTLARLLAQRGEKVLALDSDPIPGMSISLGLGPLTEPMLLDAVEKDDNSRWRLKSGIGAARAVQRYAVTAPDGVRFLQFGKADSAGLKDIMGSINGFNHVVYRLSRDGSLAEWSVVGDLPAGPRQAAYGWAPYARHLLLVVEATWQSILTARRIARITRSREGVDVLPIANKVATAADTEIIAERLGEPVWASIPSDPAVAEADKRALAVVDHSPDSPAVRAIRNLLSKLDSA